MGLDWFLILLNKDHNAMNLNKKQFINPIGLKKKNTISKLGLE